MRIDLIIVTDVRVISKFIGYKMNYSSRINYVPVGFIHAAYLMALKKDKVSMCENVKQKLLDNFQRLKRTKNAVFRL